MVHLRLVELPNRHSAPVNPRYRTLLNQLRQVRATLWHQRQEWVIRSPAFDTAKLEPMTLRMPHSMHG